MYSLGGGLAEGEESAWGFEEMEESDEGKEGAPAAGGRRLREAGESDEVEGEALAVGGRRLRPGRQERAVRRRIEDADDEEVSEGDGDEPLDARSTSLFRAVAARANYLALDRPELSFSSRSSAGA